MSYFIWVFNGENSRLPSGLFKSFEEAKNWIAKYQLNGVLSKYPLGKGVYDWAVEEGHFKPKKEKHFTPHFIGLFSTAHQEHYHFLDGKMKN